MDVVDVFTLVLTGAGAIGCLTFVTIYWLKTRGSWRKTEAGRFLMTVYLNLGTLFLLVSANRIFGDWPGREIVSLILFAAYCIFAWWPLRLLFKVNGEGRARHD